MISFLRKLTSSVYIPLGWTIFTIILLCLPGSALPDEEFVDIPDLDKVIHVILFGGVTLFWCLYSFHKNKARVVWRLSVVAIMIFAIGLGICMEYVQANFIPNRTFDTNDILANSLGAIACGIYFFFKMP